MHLIKCKAGSFTETSKLKKSITIYKIWFCIGLAELIMCSKKGYISRKYPNNRKLYVLLFTSMVSYQNYN